MPKQADPALLALVREDLQKIVADWAVGDISDATLRWDSVILRRLLDQGDLARVSHTAMGQVAYTIEAPRIENVVAPNPPAFVNFAVIGGVPTAAYPDRGAPSFVMLRRGAARPVVGPTESGRVPVTQKLSAFIEGACMVVRGQTISRRSLVLYVANKLGGAHFDLNRKDKAANQLLDEARRFGVNEREAVFLECHAIGYWMGRSPDTQRLIGAL